MNKNLASSTYQTKRKVNYFSKYLIKSLILDQRVKETSISLKDVKVSVYVQMLYFCLLLKSLAKLTLSQSRHDVE